MKNNRKFIVKSSLLVVGLLAFGITFSTFANNSASGKSKLPCTVGNVAGEYAFLADGSIQANGLGLPVGPAKGAGSITFDGQGNYSLTEAVSLNGQVINNLVDAGSYTVSSDCSCRTSSPFGTTYVLFTNDREKLIGVNTTTGITISYTGERFD